MISNKILRVSLFRSFGVTNNARKVKSKGHFIYDFIKISIIIAYILYDKMYLKVETYFLFAFDSSLSR